ncbi:hypothetical protein D3C71_2058740 [compost metagenome]
MDELPSALWQAAHTAVNVASPLTRSGLAALGASPAAKAEKTGAARAAAVSKEASNFISRVCIYVRKTSRFYNEAPTHPNFS